jgi:hypothetical protein
LAARTDPSREVRAEAVSRLNDQALVNSIARGDSDPMVRKAAVEKISEFRLLADIAQQDSSQAVRAAATGRLQDQSLLQRIARTDRDWSVRLMALQRVNQQSLVAELARTDPSQFVREAGTRLLADQEIIKSLASSPRDGSRDQPASFSNAFAISGRLCRQDGSSFAGQKVDLVLLKNGEPAPQTRIGRVPSYQTETDADGRFRIEIDCQAVHPGQTFMLAISLNPEERIVPLQRNEEQVKITIGNDSKPVEIGTVTVDDRRVER